MQVYDCLCDKVSGVWGREAQQRSMLQFTYCCSTPPVKNYSALLSQVLSQVHSTEAHTPLNCTETSVHPFTDSPTVKHTYALRPRPRPNQTTAGVQ